LGYRRIPGDLCTGGLDLNPKVMTCGYSGLVFGLVSTRNIIVLFVVAAILYYCWPYIEALLIALPIPDPKNMKESILGFIPFLRSFGSNTQAKDTRGKYSTLNEQKPE